MTRLRPFERRDPAHARRLREAPFYAPSSEVRIWLTRGSNETFRSFDVPFDACLQASCVVLGASG